MSQEDLQILYHINKQIGKYKKVTSSFRSIVKYNFSPDMQDLFPYNSITMASKIWDLYKIIKDKNNVYMPIDSDFGNGGKIVTTNKNNDPSFEQQKNIFCTRIKKMLEIMLEKNIDTEKSFKDLYNSIGTSIQISNCYFKNNTPKFYYFYVYVDGEMRLQNNDFHEIIHDENIERICGSLIMKNEENYKNIKKYVFIFVSIILLCVSVVQKIIVGIFPDINFVVPLFDIISTCVIPLCKYIISKKYKNKTLEYMIYIGCALTLLTIAIIVILYYIKFINDLTYTIFNSIFSLIPIISIFIPLLVFENDSIETLPLL
jgi:hypothetical protein